MTEQEGIIPADRAAELRSMDPVVQRRAADAARKRDERARAKVEKEAAAAAKEAGEASSFPDYWAHQRQNLTKTQRDEYEAREGDVLDIQNTMTLYLHGRYEQVALPEEHVSISEVIEATQRDIRERGLTESIILSVPKLWSEDEKPLREAILARGGATGVLLTYGYLTAIDSRLYEDFRQRFITALPALLYVSPFVQIHCTQCSAPPTAVSRETAAGYAITKNYLCGICRDRVTKEREFMKSQRREPGVLYRWLGKTSGRRKIK
jgi:hypothetical protein